MSMKSVNAISRRQIIKSSVLGLLAVPVLSIKTKGSNIPGMYQNIENKVYPQYPAIQSTVVAEVVGVSHFDLERLKKLVDKRPELARASWDWGFGDFETAIGAASHVGRKDIVDYLLQKGARPDLFTFAMLGHYDVVKSMITQIPGILKISGPHGISILQHAKTGSTSGSISKEKKEEYAQLIQYLESLEANEKIVKYLEITEDEKQKYLGDYKYGEGENDGLTIRLNMKKAISLGKLGNSGGALYKIGENRFTYNGVPSVEISFEVETDKVISLTIHEPEFTLTAKKIN